MRQTIHHIEHGRILAEMQALEHATPDHREWMRRERGLCSEVDCDAPIIGWCASCDALGPFRAPKWCAAHLHAHTTAAGHRPCLPYIS